MKPIEKNELYEHLSQFLKGRGIEMKDGSYAQRIQQGCSLLTEAVNLTQKGMERAKDEIDKRLDQMRQVIHEKTAPKPPVNPTPEPPGPAPAQNQTAEGASTPKAAKKRRAKKKSRTRMGKG